MNKISKVARFLEQDIWRISSKGLPRRKSFFLRMFRVFLLAFKKFRSNKTELNAASLTFYSLLSIVPIAAMAFGIAKGFGLEKLLAKQLVDKFPAQQETLGQVINFANNLLDHTRGGLIAGLGVIMLFWTVIKVLNSVEDSFNDIWGVKAGRTFARKVSDYLSIMLVCPLLIVTSSALTVFMGTQIRFLVSKLPFSEHIISLVMVGLLVLPYLVVWILFTFLFIFIPNTKVKFSSGLFAGIIAGTIFEIVQFFYVKFQVGVAQTNAIYGSFAALPLFLIWLQVGWRIVLLGTQLAFSHQNEHSCEFEQECLNASYNLRMVVCLEIVSLVAKRFSSLQPPLNALEIADKLDIPLKLVSDSLSDLMATRIITEIRNADCRQATYEPARDVNSLSIRSVMDILDNKGSCDIPLGRTSEFKSIVASMKSFNELLSNSPENRLLKDI